MVVRDSIPPRADSGRSDAAMQTEPVGSSGMEGSPPARSNASARSAAARAICRSPSDTGTCTHALGRTGATRAAVLARHTGPYFVWITVICGTFVPGAPQAPAAPSIHTSSHAIHTNGLM
jgi:hypothetical protein